jgi:hypothetical protein
MNKYTATVKPDADQIINPILYYDERIDEYLGREIIVEDTIYPLVYRSQEDIYYYYTWLTGIKLIKE